MPLHQFLRRRFIPPIRDLSGLLATLDFKLTANVKQDLYIARDKVLAANNIGVEAFLDVHFSKGVNVHLSGPKRLPKRTQLFTVLKAPFVHKTARDQFHLLHHSDIFSFEMMTETELSLEEKDKNIELLLTSSVAKMSLMDGIQTSWTLTEHNYVPRKEQLKDLLREL